MFLKFLLKSHYSYLQNTNEFKYACIFTTKNSHITWEFFYKFVKKNCKKKLFHAFFLRILIGR